MEECKKHLEQFLAAKDFGGYNYKVVWKIIENNGTEWQIWFQ